MMRQIKFRGLSKKKEWVFGVYFNLGYSETIVDSFYNEVDGKHDFTYNDVIQKTVGQFTGLKDKNGVDIYDGDKVLVPSGTSKGIEIEHNGEKLTAYRKSPPNTGYIVYYGASFGIHNLPYLNLSEKPYYGVLNWSGNCHSFELEIIGNIHQ